eukprot:scaffold199977_cov37-Tisochrysis_lutea.AAC.1
MASSCSSCAAASVVASGSSAESLQNSTPLASVGEGMPHARASVARAARETTASSRDRVRAPFAHKAHVA